jgi:putative DNA methylase
VTSPDTRLIEDYLPIEAISAEASREKSVRKGHISTLHLWWARRPLVACRAAVYGALVPADRWVNGELPIHGVQNVSDPKKLENWKNGAKKGLNRKAAGEFVERLCKYPGDPRAIQQAQQHILEAHADRLTAELAEGRKTDKMPAWVAEFKFTGGRVTATDIEAGRAPRPRVLDMFAGGGAIPLEALRLGCEAYALDLNPVAHIIQLCTLVYPQKYGRPDPNALGMTGPANAKGESTWGGLAEEVRYWGNWVLEKVRAEIGDLYPLIPDPKAGKTRKGIVTKQYKFDARHFEGQPELAVETPAGYLTPVIYLWTRTVRCKNPHCAAVVPLVKQTWLCKSKNRYAALKPVPEVGTRKVRFQVIDSPTESGIGFDPAAFSQGGNATCFHCGAVADSDYVKNAGLCKQIGHQLMAVVCIKKGEQGKHYVAADDFLEWTGDTKVVKERVSVICERSGLAMPNEPINPLRPSPNARGLSAVTRHGLTTFGDLFNPRQACTLLAFAAAIRGSQVKMSTVCSAERGIAVSAYLAAVLDRLADFNSSFCLHNFYGSSRIAHTFGRHAIGMTWDYAEANPFHEGSGGWGCEYLVEALTGPDAETWGPAEVLRGTATALPYQDRSVDAIICDPPYYDNVPYADVSDFFYVWLRRTIGHYFPDHFGAALTPKKAEATALASRHSGNMQKATAEYESLMFQSLMETSRVLKPNGMLALVYAHKTTLGWSTLVDSLRRAGFEVCEAWPLDTEKPGRLVAYEAAALASSIFLIARKRPSGSGAGNYEEVVQPELTGIVRERVDALWEMGIGGSDLVIAAVGAGLRAFTKYDKVEYANGEEVPAEKFLAEVEGVVLDAMMAKLVGATGGNVSAVDSASRFYTLWRYVYKTAEIDAGEAIVFTYSQHVELDGAQGLSVGKDALVKKTKAKYAALDYTERGDYEKLGLPSETGQPAPLIDMLHRVLWLMDNAPRKLVEYLNDAKPDRERLRVLAQALAGAGLSGKSETDAGKLVSTTASEQAALGKLLANWKSLIPDSLYDARHVK